MVRSFITLLALCLVLGTALAVPVTFARDDALQVAARDPSQADSFYSHRYRDVDEEVSISAREDTLEARNFWQKLKSGFSKVADFVAPVAKIATKFIREEDAVEHSARYFPDQELHFHHYREVSDDSFIREDALQTRNLWQKIKKGFSKVVDFVAPVAKIASKFIREEDAAQHSARDLQDHELHFHHYREAPVMDVVGSLRAEDDFERRWETDSDFGFARQEDSEDFVRELEELD